MLRVMTLPVSPLLSPSVPKAHQLRLWVSWVLILWASSARSDSLIDVKEVVFELGINKPGPISLN